jgi:transcriptional regulator with XRE-family HTH domain/uncharacterized damage-inducible protein DinB
VTPLRTIGEALRSAREAQGKSLDDAAVATRIRPSYLEALEEEQFGELGGSVYAKGFLRSYAGYLGVDPAPLLEAYRAQETPGAPLFEHAPRAIGGLKPGRAGRSWLAAAIVCVSIVLLVSLWGLLRPAPDPGDAQPAFVTTPARTTGAGNKAGAAARPAPATTARPAAGDVTVTLRYAGASWTRVTADGRGRLRGHPGAAPAPYLHGQAQPGACPRLPGRGPSHRQRQGPGRGRPLRQDLAPHLHPQAQLTGRGEEYRPMVIRVPFTGAEKESLQVALERHRDAVLWKLEGLGDDDLRRQMTPSGTSLLGLVKHLAAVEYGWFCDTFGRETEPLPFDDTPDADLRIRPDETTEEVLAFYGRARAAADRAIDELEVEDTGTAWFGEAVTLRWVLIHMVEETARHAGHADIIRELIDGMAGDHRPG